MAEYINREALIDQIAPDDPCDKYLFATMREVKAAFRDIISDFPAADVVEVVRCIECEYWDGIGYEGRCEAPKNGLIREYSNYDDFCSYGVRKGGGSDA